MDHHVRGIPEDAWPLLVTREEIEADERLPRWAKDRMLRSLEAHEEDIRFLKDLGDRIKRENDEHLADTRAKVAELFSRLRDLTGE